MSKETIPSEEVDLGNLFKIIGKGIQNFFNAIGRFFAALYHYLILFLLFIRNNAIKLSLAALIGAIIGLYFDMTSPPVYSSVMIVEPNFNSTQQLYNNCAYYHELVKQKDSTRLAEALGISRKEAAQLKGFYIEPVRNKNEKYEAFSKFLKEVDTALVEDIRVEDFKKGFSNLDYKYHLIKVKSTSNLVFSKLGSPIVNSIGNNPYYKKLKNINEQNLLQNEEVLAKSLSEMDTLRKIYNEVLITEAKKNETGTSITLAQGVKKTEEVELFNESLKLNQELIENNKEKAKSTEILNIVSTFNNIGEKERSIYKKKSFILGSASFLLMMAFILRKQANIYLSNYRMNKQ